LSGFGGASGSIARWNSSHARRRNAVDGFGTPAVASRSAARIGGGSLSRSFGIFNE